MSAPSAAIWQSRAAISSASGVFSKSWQEPITGMPASCAARAIRENAASPMLSSTSSASQSRSRASMTSSVACRAHRRQNRRSPRRLANGSAGCPQTRRVHLGRNAVQPQLDQIRLRPRRVRRRPERPRVRPHHRHTDLGHPLAQRHAGKLHRFFSHLSRRLCFSAAYCIKFSSA